MSEQTFQRLRGTYRTREIDRVIVKGKSEPVGIYEILDYHTESTFPNLVDALAHFRDGLARYRSQNWDGARREFEAVLAINPAEPIDWSEVAGGGGYFDQAHFGHEFRAFTGLTPTRYLEVRRRFLREHPGHVLDGWSLPAD